MVNAPQIDTCDLYDFLDNCTGDYWGETMWDGKWHPAGHSFGEHEYTESDMARYYFGCFDFQQNHP